MATKQQTASDRITQQLTQLASQKLATINSVPSNWQYLDYLNGGISIGAGIGLGVTGGTLKIQNGNGPIEQYNCGSLDVGVGLAAIPADISFSVPGLPEAGAIYPMPISLGNLTAKSFRGAYLAFTLMGGMGMNIEGNIFFMGSVPLPLPMSPWGSSAFTFAASAIAGSKVVVFSAGFSGAFQPGIGLTSSLGVAV
jgi:hypothetical protein